MEVLNIKNENIITTGNIKLYLCDICNDTYSLERSFKLHYRAHKSFPCEVCHQVFTLKRDLNAHLRTHDEDNNRTYMCAVCDKEFASKNQVKKHLKIHEAKRHVCKICNAEFSNVEELRKHRVTHKKHACGDCHASFHRQSELKRHACAAAVQEFRPSDATVDYRKHPNIKEEVLDSEDVVISHETEKSHLSDASAVKREVDHNTSDKPYFCEMCEKGFRRKSTLISHICAKKKKLAKPKKKKEKQLHTASFPDTNKVLFPVPVQLV